MRYYDDGLLLGWPYKQSGGQQVVDWENPIIDKEQGHIFTAALTGEGKGVSYSVPALLSWPGSAVVLDIKGELSCITARRRKKMGQKVYVLDPFKITKFKGDQLNPLDILDPDDAGMVSTMTQLSTLLTANIRMRDDAFWEHSARSMISGITLQLIEENGAGNVTLDDVADTIDNPEDKKNMLIHYSDFSRGYKDKRKAIRDYVKYKNEFDNAPSLIKGMLNSEHRIVRQCGYLLDRDVSRTRQSIQTIAAQALTIAEGGYVSKSLSRTTIPLKKLINGKPMTIYIVIPPEKLKSHNKILRLWIGLIFSLFSKRRNWSGPETLLLLDEVAQLGEMDELSTAITLLRTYGVKVWSIWQDSNQPQSCYPHEWKTLLNNCRTQLWFGFTNMKLASDAADIIGGFSKEELFNLEAQDAVLVRARHSPEIIRRPDYLRQDMWKGNYDQNPYYAADSKKSGQKKNKAVIKKLKLKSKKKTKPS